MESKKSGSSKIFLRCQRSAFIKVAVLGSNFGPISGSGFLMFFSELSSFTNFIVPTLFMSELFLFAWISLYEHFSCPNSFFSHEFHCSNTRPFLLFRLFLMKYVKNITFFCKWTQNFQRHDTNNLLAYYTSMYTILYIRSLCLVFTFGM